MGYPMLFGERLRSYRKQRQLSQQELAYRINVNPSLISMFETGYEGRVPSRTTAQALAEALELPLTEAVDFVLAAIMTHASA